MKEENSTFLTKDGLELASRWWLPDDAPKAVVVLVHGIAEHKGRYAHLAKAFNDVGIAVGSYDHRGHGESPGDRIVVYSFDQLSDDLEVFIGEAKSRFAALPLFVFGHSMGTLVAGNYAGAWKHDVQGFLFSAMAIVMNDDIPQWMVNMSGIISRILPKIRLLTLDSASISHDPQVIKNYDEDPLNFRGGVPAVTGAQMVVVAEKIVSNLKNVVVPTLVMHGEDDSLTSPEGSQVFYDGIAASDKTLKYYPGMYHEIINEIGKEEPISDMVNWVLNHL